MDNQNPNIVRISNNFQNNPEPKSKKGKIALIVLIIIIILILLGLAAYFIIPKLIINEEPVKEVVEKEYKPAVVLSSKFVAYKENPINISPKIPDYKVEDDLSNVINKADFKFSSAALNLLTKNGFVVVPSSYQEFYTIYEMNRYSQTPNFITTDSMLHSYHLMFDYTLKKLEEEKLTPELKSLNERMLSSAIEQYDTLKGTEWENAAKRNIGFFTVGSKLLDPNIDIPQTVKNEVEQELSLIEAHQQIQSSPVMNIGFGEDTFFGTPQGVLPLESLKEDYTQYIPRGHYTKTEELKNYFKSMMWYGRITFQLKEEDRIKSAILITLTLNKGENEKSWDKIYEPINFFVGKSDDITYYNFKDLISQVYGQNVELKAVLEDKDKFASFVKSTKDLEPPQINSMPIFQASIQADREEEIKGFRFMGQRFTVDASIFQRLIVREVGPKEMQCSEAPFSEGRMLPKGLDIPAAMGSKEALSILEDEGELEYACYPENMDKMKKYISGLSVDTWTQNLYWGWMYSLLSLTTEKTEGYPSFMRNSSWARKELNTYLGSWTELKRDTILYAKQVYAELGGAGFEEKDYRGYVEPNPYLYARLASLLKMTEEGLQTRDLLSDKIKENLERLNKLALSLKTISEKELNNESLSEEEYDLIKAYGGDLEHIWYEIFSEETENPILDDNSNSPVVADVATDPNGSVLEEGTGYVYNIYAVVPVDGKLRIANGGVYSYYEFAWPMSDRLTDAKWKGILKSGNAPKLPSWTNSFIAK